MKLVNKKRKVGQGMTEYIIIVALIAVAAIGAFKYFGQTARTQVAGLSLELSGENGDQALEEMSEIRTNVLEEVASKDLKSYSGGND